MTRINNSRRVAPLMLVAGVLVVATACTSTTTSPATSTISVPDLPEIEPGLRTLLTLTAQAGDSRPVDITVIPGDVLATMRCTGGPLEMHLDGVAWATVQCDVGGISPVRNVFNVHAGTKVRVYVKAGDGVRWNMRVEER